MGLARVSLEPQEAIESSRNAVSGQQDCTWGRRSGPDEAEAPPTKPQSDLQSFMENRFNV